ncbi:MAG TPA: adenylate/guanylate cyclase domain-containing protein, partial [Polyangia bacterium]|nr:adenylate/guanylate cyclase domain-containing protein [Polyangia bacterium]
TAGDGEAALASVRRTRPDMIVTDVQMPRMNGLELVRALKNDPGTRSIPVLMLTASVEEKDLVAGLGLGVEDYVRKPFSLAEMQARISNILSRAREKEVLRATFERYVAPEVVQELLGREEGPILTGEKKPIVVFFCDIRGFTALSEDTDAGQVVAILNQVLTIATEVILKWRGTLDKFLGDGAMALFGAPVSYGDDAERAVRAALELQERMRSYNQGARRAGRHREIELGIGLHAGEAVVGNVGSEQRMTYTAIGSCVNIAARLQALAAPGEIIVSRAVISALGGRAQAEELTPVVLKGLRDLFAIYSVTGLAPARAHP